MNLDKDYEETCLNHRRKYGLISTDISFNLECYTECEAEPTCPMRPITKHKQLKGEINYGL